MMPYIILLVFTLVIPLLVQGYLRNTYGTWSQKANSANLTGAEVANAILQNHGLTNVRVERVSGHLSDHYDPRAKAVRLSSANYDNPSVAGMAVAAHEVGHALQHAQSYAPLKWRSAVLPAASFGGSIAQILLFAGVVLAFLASTRGLGMQIAILGLIAFGAVAVFQLVTLPVEFDASRRARVELEKMGLVTSGDSKGIGNVLNAAALTYVAALVATIAQIVYYALLIFGSRD